MVQPFFRAQQNAPVRSQPEPHSSCEAAFDARGFEWWHHAPDRYFPDEPPAAEETVDEDYVPAYSWLDSATRDLRERAKSKEPSRRASSTKTLFASLFSPRERAEPLPEKPLLRLVDDEVERELMEERAARADELTARLSLHRAVMALEIAAEKWPQDVPWSEMEPTFRRAEAALRSIKKQSSRGPFDWLHR